MCWVWAGLGRVSPGSVNLGELFESEQSFLAHHPAASPSSTYHRTSSELRRSRPRSIPSNPRERTRRAASRAGQGQVCHWPGKNTCHLGRQVGVDSLLQGWWVPWVSLKPLDTSRVLRAVHTSGDAGMTSKAWVCLGVFPTQPGVEVWDWPVVIELEGGAKVVTEPRAQDPWGRPHALDLQ